jgi:hypothetical protein
MTRGQHSWCQAILSEVPSHSAGSAPRSAPSRCLSMSKSTIQDTRYRQYLNIKAQGPSFLSDSRVELGHCTFLVSCLLNIPLPTLEGLDKIQEADVLPASTSGHPASVSSPALRAGLSVDGNCAGLCLPQEHSANPRCRVSARWGGHAPGARAGKPGGHANAGADVVAAQRRSGRDARPLDRHGYLCVRGSVGPVGAATLGGALV